MFIISILKTLFCLLWQLCFLKCKFFLELSFVTLGFGSQAQLLGFLSSWLTTSLHADVAQASGPLLFAWLVPVVGAPPNPLPPLTAAFFLVHFELWFPFSRRIKVCLSFFMSAHGFWYTKSAPCILDMLEDFLEMGFPSFLGVGVRGHSDSSRSVCCPDPAGAVSVTVWPPCRGWMEGCIVGNVATLLIYSLSLGVFPSKL